MADIFPDTGQIRLAHLASSEVSPFVVDQVATAWALLVVAIGPDCAPLGARPPQIEIQTGTRPAGPGPVRHGPLTDIPQAPATASIVDETLAAVGTASWTRGPFDVFAVTIHITNPDDRPWAVRFTNTDPVELGFVWSTAASADKARQPRVVMDTTPLRTTAIVGKAQPTISIPISNIGTGPLTINSKADQAMGAGYRLHTVPPSIPPNGCDHLDITVDAASVPPATAMVTATFVLDCDDPVTREVTLQLSRDEKGKEDKDQKDVNKEDKEDKDGKDRKDHKDGKDSGKESPREFLDAAAGASPPPEHFIPPTQRPDLADSALRDEPPEPGRTEG
ncbi:hypothetical protein AB0F71_21535 [Kitasatospora sp. NPDC028055]|uniref:hypothetical protein n=1 Tax=Kitasatospora sp. NPDC028055 TaxID=3155653 RepID=UPI0033EEBACE